MFFSVQVLRAKLAEQATGVADTSSSLTGWPEVTKSLRQKAPRRRKSSQVAEQWNVWSNRGACSWGRYENQIAEMEMFMKQTWEERPKWFSQVAAARHSLPAWIYFNRIKRSSPFSTKKKEKDLNKRRFRRIKFERLCHVLVSCFFVDPWRSLQTSHLTSVPLWYLAIFRILPCMCQHVFFF